MAPPCSQKKSTNALQMLMQQSKGRKAVPAKKRGGSSGSAVKHSKSKSTGFVDCPAGCGRHIANLQHKINQHLDKHCEVMMRDKREQQPKPVDLYVPKEEEPVVAIKQQTVEQDKGKLLPAESVQNSPTQEPVDPPTCTTATPNDPASMDCCTGTTNSTSMKVSLTPQEQEIDANDTMETTNEAGEVKDCHHNEASSLVSPEQSQAAQTTTPNNSNNPYHGTTSKRNLRGASAAQTQPAVQQSTPKQNVFAHMMQQSSKVFAKKPSATEIPQYFSLEYDAAKESFACKLDTNPPLDAPPSLWTCTASVKDKPNQSTIALALSVSLINYDSSNVPSPNHTWVQHHSRLSVPVLKSILQKSVRRRRPLPSVRVAMELMDKALGELTRRLPIIILEDSSLHPDFALLVWAMVAHSKGFFYTDDHPTPQHLVVIHAFKLRLLRIVYQVASCPVQDHLSVEQSEDETDRKKQPSLSDPFPQVRNSKETTTPNRQKEQLQLSIWAMLVRAQYGGMACDVRMLQGFAGLWQDRLHDNSNIPPELKVKDWTEVPTVLHAIGLTQSTARIPATVVLYSLTLTDLCKEGVDFHCSNIVCSLLEDKDIAGESGVLAKELDLSSNDLLIKRCIWKYSAGVNLRRPLIAGGKQSTEEEEPLKAFWKRVLLPPVTSYQTKYIGERIWR